MKRYDKSKIRIVISYEDIKNIRGKPVQIREEDIKKLEACIEDMDDEGCSVVVEKIFAKLSVEQNMKPEDFQLLSLNLILLGVKKMPFMQLQINEFLCRNILALESIAKFTTIEQMKSWTINILKVMNELMFKESIPEKRDVIENGKNI